MLKNRICLMNAEPLRKLDTVGVVGSIPIARTIKRRLKRDQVIEIPNDYEVIPAVDYSTGYSVFSRILVKKTAKKCDFSVTSRRAKKSS